MKYFLTFLFLLFVQLSNLNAQVVFDLKSIDFIIIEDDGNLLFYEKKGNKCREVEIYFELPCDTKYALNIFKEDWKDVSAVLDSTHAIIKVKDIKAYSPKALLKHFNKYQHTAISVQAFKDEITKTDAKESTFSYMQLFNSYMMLLTYKEVNVYVDNTTDSIIDDVLARFCLLNLGFNKHIILFHPLDIWGYVYDQLGYFIPQKKNNRLYLGDYNFHKNERYC